MEELKEICIDQLEVFLSDGEFRASQINVIIYYYYFIYLFPFHILITEKYRIILCGCRKYPNPHHGRIWNFHGGGGGDGGSEAQEIPESRGVGR